MPNSKLEDNCIVMEAVPGNFKLAKNYLKEFLSRVQGTFKDETSLYLALDELYANVMMYAYKGLNKEKSFYLSLEETKDGCGVIMTIRDDGIPFNPLLKADPIDLDASAKDRKIGGLGIFIIKSTSDNIEYCYENEQNVLKLTYMFKKELHG